MTALPEEIGKPKKGDQQEGQPPAETLDFMSRARKDLSDDFEIPANDPVLQNIERFERVTEVLRKRAIENRKNSDSLTRNVIGRHVIWSFLALISVLSLGALIAAFFGDLYFERIMTLIKEVATIMMGLFGAILGYFFAKESDS